MNGRDLSGLEFGAIVRRHREARGLDIDALCAAIGGTPGAGFLISLEAGSIGPSSSLVLKIANALELPDEMMLNAAGFATQVQRAVALAALTTTDKTQGPDT
ncbi:MAG: helix-turn-helix transcriptional regulator [Candidatus Limnocylindrales bacterium]